MVRRRVDTSRMPAQLELDMSDVARSGIRITLRAPAVREVPEPRVRQSVVREDTAPYAAVAYADVPRSPLPPVTLKRAAVDCVGAVCESAAIRSLEYAVVDVETTGGSWGHGHRITEIAAVRMRGDGAVIDEYRSLVNPERSIPHFITALTNITWEMVCDAPRFAEVAPQVARVLNGAVFVAHNASFDWRFVGAELDRAGVPLTGSTLCTVRLARKVVPELRSRSLDSLTYFFNIPVHGRHRAYGDAVATAQLFRHMLDRLDTMEVSSWNDLQTLLRRRARRKKRRAMPQPATDVEP